MGRLPDDAVEAVLEPLDGLVLVDLVVGADGGLAATALGNTLTGAGPIAKIVNCVPRWGGRVCGALTCSSRSPCRRYQYPGRT